MKIGFFESTEYGKYFHSTGSATVTHMYNVTFMYGNCGLFSKLRETEQNDYYKI